MTFIPDQPSGCIDQANQALRVNVVAGGGAGGFFQATQPVSAVSLPLPANAAQETSGNLDTLVALQKSMLQLLELQREQLAVLKAIQVQHANAYGDIVDSSQFVGDVSIQ